MEQRQKRKKRKTKLIKFGNKRGNEIISSKWIKSISDKIEDIGSYNVYSKYYNFLNKKNIYSLKSKNLLFSVNTYGKKMLLFLIKFNNNKNYCIFINKKTGNMILSRFRFVNNLFDGTLMIGDFIKDNKTNNWNFIIDDLVYYKGENIITETFTNRFNILDNMLNTEFENDTDLSICQIKMKKYYELKYIKYITDNKEELFDYKVSGLFFKNIDNFSDNYLYTFLECRSDCKIKLASGSDNISNNNLNILNNNLNNKSNNNNLRNKKSKLNRKYIIMEIRTTSLPDIYELYHMNSNKKLEMNSYASIPNNKICKYIRKIFKKKEINEEMSSESEISDCEECENIKIRCYYHEKFKKFVPYKLDLESLIDNINIINQFIYS